ncbi:unnamed protein product [Larinioides sclopetarius]|uniref:Uncharacterized protein n=1 Tax=Larinioides sclopetarius TaxID=280406 RepID=A0AAV2AU86_9ARAC
MVGGRPSFVIRAAVFCSRDVAVFFPFGKSSFGSSEDFCVVLVFALVGIPQLASVFCLPGAV